MAQEEIAFDDEVDITDAVCPMTFVRAKAAIEELEIGQVLKVHLNEGEPMQNVPRSLKDDGQQVLRLAPSDEETFDLYVKKLVDE
ncbi:MAG: sulfurtransferase TusA family protein [Clostridium sp.]|nr:sulfurtransferase TusA family protein [Clostridium sp.]